eukprot:TRINITY_DN0_c3_g1_i2.p1 TRINITY_DN0_c3_g1~~TRINITY_DN0_c3_g1_i2.p1  ORF type:complete len:289 (+),score=40.69 TRINITY_DN0_c3_g1_i2:282-1148(+)
MMISTRLRTTSPIVNTLLLSTLTLSHKCFHFHTSTAPSFSKRFYYSTTSTLGNESNSNDNAQHTNEHFPLTRFQRVLLATGSAIGGLINPYRADFIATLGETTGECALSRLKGLMENDHQGQQILRDRPRINMQSLDWAYLKSLPSNSFGYSYAQWMDSHEFSPDERPKVKFLENPDLAYIMQRYREVHDLWHVLFGLDVSVSHEIAGKMIEAIQTRLPMCVASAVGGPLRLSFTERNYFITHLAPFAIRAGKNAKFLMNVYYEKYWETDLNTLRQNLNIEPWKPPSL